MRQNFFSFKEFSCGKHIDLMTLPTSLGNKKDQEPEPREGKQRMAVTNSLFPLFLPLGHHDDRHTCGATEAGCRESCGSGPACPQHPELPGTHWSLVPNPDPAKRLFFTFGGSVSQVSPSASRPCPAPPSAVSPDAEHSEWHRGTDPSQDRHGEKLCFFSCQAGKTSVTRGCAAQMGFSLWFER